MATGKSGTLTWTSGSFSVRATWSETYDTNANTSTVSVSKLEVMTSAYSGIAYYPDGKLQVNGTTIYTFNSALGNEMADIRAKNEWYPIVNSNTKVEITYSSVEKIAHNADGSKSINITLAANRFSQFSFFVTGGGYGSGWGVLGSQKITLTTIPRSSSITSASNITLGNACSVKWTPASASFHYKLKFVLGSWNYTTGVISPNTTSSYTYSSYTIPVDVANQITKATTGTMTAYLYTYNSSTCTTQVGSTTSKTFTVTVPSTIIPTISSANVTIDNGANSVVAGWGLYVAGYSKAKITASASGSYGSTISSYTISGGYSKTVSGTSLSWTGGTLSSGSKTFKVVAKDSRGRVSSSKDAGTITVYSYSTPTISSFKVERSSSNAEKMIVVAKWNYASVNGKNSATATLKYKKSSDTAWTTYNGTITNGTNNLTGTFEETSSYNFAITIKDALGKTAISEVDVPTIQVLMDFRPGGKGLGIGKIAETDSLEVAMESNFYNKSNFYNNLYISDDYEILSLDATGESRSLLRAVSSNGNTLLGYGNYTNEDANTNIYGNAINLYTKDAVYPRSQIRMPNNVSISGAMADGENYRSMMYISPENNMVIGYGGYVNGDVITKVCGKDITIHSATAGASYRPYYRAGDEVNVEFKTAGYVTNNPGMYVYFIIPLYKPVLGSPTVTVSCRDGFILRQNNNYTHGSTSEIPVNQNIEITAKLSISGIRVLAKFDNATNVTNNSAIGIHFDGTITFS